MSKKVKLRRGILGVKCNPNKPILFNFRGESWPSDDDSSDSDYMASGMSSPPNYSIDSTVTSNLKNSAIEVDSKGIVVEETKEDGGMEVGITADMLPVPKNGKRNSGVRKSPGCRKQPQKKHWVVSNGTNSEGTMTLKLKLDEHSKRRRKKDRDSVKIDSSQNADFEEGPWGTKLPVELLVRIFQEVIRTEGNFPFMDEVATVCNLWREASTHKSMWESVDLSSGFRQGDLFLRGLFQRQDLSGTKKLSLAGWGKNLTDLGIKEISSICKNLSSINLSMCINLTGNGLKLLVNSCPNLGHINISGTTKGSTNSMSSPTNSLKYVFEKCASRLVYLNISENSIGNLGTTLKCLAKHCPNLKVLDASNMYSNTAQILPVEELQAGCPQLAVLRLANGHISLSPTPLSRQVKAPGFPELEELSIAENDTHITPCVIGDNDLDRLLKSSHKLKLLDVRGCHNISVSGLVRLPAWHLEHLYLSKCDATRTLDLELVLNKWKHSLRDVDLSWAKDPSAIDQALTALACSEEDSVLEYLDLSGSSVSYTVVQKLLGKCKMLQSLNLQSCRSLPRGIKRLYSGKELNTLKECVANATCQDALSPVHDSAV